MKKLIFTATVLATMTLSLGLTGCSNDNDKNDDRQKAMVAILKDSSFDYWHQIAQGFSEECNAKGLVPLVFYTKDEINSQAQIDIVNHLNTSDYDIQGIALAPIWTENDRKAEQAVADFASKHGIPVSIVDSPVDDKTTPLKSVYVCYVGTDNYSEGRELAAKIPCAADSILVVRDKNSTPTLERYNGLRAVKGEKIKLWNTDVNGIDSIQDHLDSGINSIVFLNGHLCKEALSNIGIYNVYTFDIYSEYAPLLDEDTFLKGIVAQNTLKIGHECVKDLLSTPGMKNHCIPTIYFDHKSVLDPPAEAQHLIEYLKKNSPFSGKSVLLALGNKDYVYWQEICAGAVEKAKELGVELQTVFGQTETDSTTVPNAIANCASIKDLIGVAGQINRKEYDDACASIPEGVNLTLIEGVCYKGGISEHRYNGIVSVNNAHYANEFLSHIPEQKLLVLSYSTGNNVTLTEEYIKLRGAENIRPIYLDEAACALDSLKSINLKDYDAIIFNSGNFVREECMEYVEGKTVYSSDLNSDVQRYISSGAITLNITPDTRKFGHLVLLSTITGASYEVPFILTSQRGSL